MYVRATVVLELRESGLQCAVDVRAPAGVDALDEAQGRFARLFVEPLQLGAEALYLAVVGDDVEQIVVVEVVQHKPQGTLGLFDLLAAHAARSIDHEERRLLDRFALGRFDFGADQQQKITLVVPLGPIAEQTRTDFRVPHVVHQQQVGSGDFIRSRERHHGIAVVPGG